MNSMSSGGVAWISAESWMTRAVVGESTSSLCSGGDLRLLIRPIPLFPATLFSISRVTQGLFVCLMILIRRYRFGAGDGNRFYGYSFADKRKKLATIQYTRV
ncbi:hypothetical protein [Acetobacter estunensis]|uniref:hypothetical protein n=1 Tax=Acetobacter estunensis TaxID=104097 RepID=UPI00222E469C|nr:hypothetical protein [Acetobacter estunensis]